MSAAVVLDHDMLPILIVDGFVASARRLGISLKYHRGTVYPRNPCADLAICVAGMASCTHGLRSVLAIIGEGGVAARCGECWPGLEAPEQCPTCRRSLEGALWLAGLFTGCRSCGEIMIADYTGRVRVMPEDLMALLLPHQRGALVEARREMTRAGASA